MPLGMAMVKLANIPLDFVRPKEGGRVDKGKDHSCQIEKERPRGSREVPLLWRPSRSKGRQPQAKLG